MSLRYSGPATLHCDAGIFAVHADLSTVVASGTYSWGVLLRVTGHGRAPYERDGEIIATPREGGGTYYQAAE